MLTEGTPALIEYVMAKSTRGECQCGECFDRGEKPDPTGHTADLMFFKVGVAGKPDADTFRRLTAEHVGAFGSVDPFDGDEHGFMELGGWIGDQGLAMQYMGLGTVLGVFKLLSPKTMLGDLIPAELQMTMAQRGLLTVVAV